MDRTDSAETRSVEVQRYDGETTEGRRLYTPLRVLDFLVAKAPLEFDVYEYGGDGRLVLLFGKGTIVPPEWREEWEIRNPGKTVYTPLDQKRDLLAYEERMLPAILEDPEIPARAKCAAIQDVTTSITHRMLEEPNAVNIRAQKETVSRLVDFALREPQAVRGLLRLTHHDYRTYTHSVNVGIYATSMAIQLLRSNAEHNLHEVSAGFFLHDVGKSRIPSSIINKAGQLDPSEWSTMRCHPALGYEILFAEKADTVEAAVIALQHHERLDGKGYPKGLAEAEIHLYARVCALADVYDALTTRRSYKAPMSPFKALAIMKESVSTQFDPEIYKLFVGMMGKDFQSDEAPAV